MMDRGAAMRRHLGELKALRGSEAVAPERLAELKRFQSGRLAHSYADIAADPRYRAATTFFLEDLYGPKDFSRRDESLLRILPAMTRMMPASAVDTATLAVELEALSESLDHRTAGALPPGPVDEQGYAQAYRAVSKREERLRQIDLIVSVGERLDAVVKVPLVHRTLRFMRAPARAAGLDDLQRFLERGFEAFRAMHGAREFLDTIRSREVEILNRLFSGDPRPFSG
jgi:hypothetical protein